MEFPQGWGSYQRAGVEHRLAREMRLLDQTVARPQGQVLLDVGVGEGPYLQGYMARGFRVIGLDNNHDGLCQLETPHTVDGQHLSLVAGDAKRLPLLDASVDVVFMCQVLEHLNDPSIALREAHRVLKPGGWLFLDVPWWHEMFRPLSAVLMRQLQAFKAKGRPTLFLRSFFRYQGGRVKRRPLAKPLIKLLQLLPTFSTIVPEAFMESYVKGELPECNMHLHFYLPGEWRRLVEAAGFRVKSVAGAWLTPPPLNRLGPFNRLFLRVESNLGDRLLARSGQILIIAAVKPG